MALGSSVGQSTVRAHRSRKIVARAASSIGRRSIARQAEKKRSRNRLGRPRTARHQGALKPDGEILGAKAKFNPLSLFTIVGAARQGVSVRRRRNPQALPDRNSCTAIAESQEWKTRHSTFPDGSRYMAVTLADRRGAIPTCSRQIRSAGRKWCGLF